MYPETKGVPLEEMDLVFGEGTFCCIRFLHITLIEFGQDEREEREENADDDEDNEVDGIDETTSLLSTATPNGSRKRPHKKGWFGIFKRRPTAGELRT